MIAQRLRCFRETGRGCRGVFVLRLRKGCYGFDWRTQFCADMTAVGRRDASSDHPRHKRKQNCLFEFPNGKGGAHNNIHDQRRTSCQSTESKASSVATTVQHFEDLLDLVLTVLFRSGVERMGDTMLKMVTERLLLDLVESGTNRTKLVQDVDAITLFLDHPGDSAHLAFDTAEAGELRLLDFAVHALHYTPVRYIWQA